MPLQPLNVFISCSPADKDRRLLDELLKHLAPLQRGDEPLIKTWDDAHILPGNQWDEEIKQNLRQADIVLLLISADFNNTRYIQEVELTVAIERSKAGACKTVPVYLRSCDYQGMPYEPFGMLPDNRPVQEWPDPDAAFTVVVKRLRELVEELRRQKAALPPRIPVDMVAWSDPWHPFFRGRPPVKDLQLLDTVNCDRWDKYPLLERDFERHKLEPGNLVYFITACNTQKPESLVRRLAYWFDEDFSLYFRPDEEKKKDELAVLPLEFGKREEVTWGKFWELFKKNILQCDVEFEAFVRDPGPLLSIPENTRLLLSFKIDEDDLKQYKGNKHIRYILEQFARLPPAFQKFVFCFVFHFYDVHDSGRQRCEFLLDLLDNMVRPADQEPEWRSGLHITSLNAVPVADVTAWLNGRFHYKHLPDLTGRLSDNILPARREAYLRQACYDMDIIEEMQYAAYTYNRDKPI